MNITDTVNFFKRLLQRFKKPAATLPAILLKCTASTRPGVSAMEITSRIIELCKAGGIPTGPNADGSMNLVNYYTYAVVKSILEGIKTDGVIQVVIPKNSLLIESNGGNAGGPIVTIGTNKTDSIAKGIFR